MKVQCVRRDERRISTDESLHEDCHVDPAATGIRARESAAKRPIASGPRGMGHQAALSDSGTALNDQHTARAPRGTRQVLRHDIDLVVAPAKELTVDAHPGLSRRKRAT